MFDFPNAPTNGQLVQGGAGQFYAWDGAKWVGQMPPGPLPIASGGTGAITGALALDGLSGVSGATAGALQRSSGGVWSVSAVGGSTVVVSDTPPASPTVGSQWFDGVSATMFVWFNDGTSSQWVPVINQPGVGSPVSIANGGTGVTTAAAAPWVELVGDQMSGPLVINQNAAALPALTVPTQLTLGAANETGAELALVSFGNTSAGSQYQTYRSRGTAAARTAIQGPTDFIGQVRFNGYDGSAWGVGCAITGRAAVAGAWTGTNRQSTIEFWTVPPGSATLTNRMMLGDGLVVGIGADPGPGCIYTTGEISVVPPSTHPIIHLRKPSGTSSLASIIHGWTGAAVRWGLVLGDGANEAGGNSGSNFVVWRYNDSGVLVDAPLSINRINGEVSLAPSAVVIGTGQVGGWSTTGAKGGSILLTDLGQAAGCGGAIEFAAAPNSAWRFAAIKGYATNGAGNSQGEIDFFVRVGASDATLTKKGALASDGVWYNTNASWSALSDVSVKENIAPYTNGLAAIIGLRPVIFDYIEASPFGPVSARIGLVAQEAEEFTPEIVGQYQDGDAPTLKTTNSGLLIYTLINAIKELASRVEGLEAAS